MNEKKLTRICWNTNNWQYPSGKKGKSKDAYEGQDGYGHEEWLLDTGKLIDGYHYGYIRGVMKSRNRILRDETGKIDIFLYSVNYDTKEHWWIGELQDVSIVKEDESMEILKIYKSNKWLEEMGSQLQIIGISPSKFYQEHNDYPLFCLKFRPEEMNLFDDPITFTNNDRQTVPTYRYMMLPFNDAVQTPSYDSFHFTPGQPDFPSNALVTHNYSSNTIELEHNQIQEKICEILRFRYGDDNVGCELNTGAGTRVDIVVKRDDGYIFYELKTSNTAKKCIREALPQLLEYAYFPDASRAFKIVVISPVPLDVKSKKYLEYLRKRFYIPIYYCWFNQADSTLGGEE